MKLIPFWCPGGGFKTKAAVAAKCVRDLYDVPYDMVREKMVRTALHIELHYHKRVDFRFQRNGTARPSFTSNLIEELDRDGNLTDEYEECIKGAAATIYAGKSITRT